MAVVSWPASSSVSSSSRTSRSVSCPPSSSRASSSAENTSSRCGQVRRLAPARDLGVQDLVDGPLARLELASAPRPLAAAADHGRDHQQPARARQRLDHRPQPARAAPPRPGPARSRTPPAGSPAASATACSAAARTARRPATSRSRGPSQSRIVSAWASICRPWKGGSISRRWRRCSAPSSSSTERWPTIGPSRALASPACSWSSGALEHLLDQLGVEHHHEALVEQRPERDRVAVAAPAGLQEARAAEHEAGGLEQARERGPGGRAAVPSAHAIVPHGAGRPRSRPRG